MTVSRRHASKRTGTFVALSILFSAVGCAGQPASTPTPTPTGFSSEEEAFAAAKETYIAQVAATNNVDLSNPESFEPMFALSSGSYLAADRQNFSEMNRNSYTLDGKARIISFEGLETRAKYSIVTARACLDVSQVQITDPSGASQVHPQRPDVYPLKLTFVANPQNELLVDAVEVLADEPCV